MVAVRARRETPLERYQKAQQQMMRERSAWDSYYRAQAQAQAQPQPQRPSPYTMAPATPAAPATPPAPAPQTSTGSVPPPTGGSPSQPSVIGEPAYTEARTNYFGASTGNADNAYRAYQDIYSNTGSLAWDALMNNRDAQIELYNTAGGTSDSFANWLRNRGDTFYNRFVADSAATNDIGAQFSDWLHGRFGTNIQHEYLRGAPESRNFFRGIAQPQARYVMQG